MKMLYFKELWNKEATKKITTKWQKTQGRLVFSDEVLFLNMYFSYSEIKSY